MTERNTVDLPGPRDRGLGRVVLCALFLSALPLWRGLLDGDRILFGVDTAAAQLPWSAVLEDEQAGERPRNPALHDQATVFYPAYRWVAESWMRGDAPLWNPLIYAGAPALGNPQTGVLDPQVGVLVGLEALGGKALFDRGFAFLAWLRLFAAGLGAYLLARRLGLAPHSSALAGIAFGFSGFLQLWLNHSLGHVAPLLPWVLLGLEGIRGPRPARAALGTTLALLLAILGGHPETAFYIGLASGVWALSILARNRRAGLLGLGALAAGTLLAAPLLIPFLEYLSLSASQAVREAEAGGVGLDVFALGIVLLLVGLVVGFRRTMLQPGEQQASSGVGMRGLAFGLVMGTAGALALLAGRGLPATAGLTLLPDLLGHPGAAGGYHGPGAYLEAAGTWLALPALVLALASWLSPSGPMRRRGLVAVLGVLALALALETPGLIDLMRHVPLFGLGATGRLGVVAALFLSLAAAEGLEAAGRQARISAGLVCAALCGLLFLGGESLEPGAVEPEQDELVGFLLVPEPDLRAGTGSGSLVLEGWLHPGLPASAARAVFAPAGPASLGEGPRPIEVPLEILTVPSERARPAMQTADVPEGARFFHATYLQVDQLPTGRWKLAVELIGSDGATIGRRQVGVLRLERPSRPGGFTLAVLFGTLLLLCLRPGVWVSWALMGLACLQGLFFASGLNPAVPRDEAFPATRTEELLAEQAEVGALAHHRVFGDPHVLAPSTGMVRGLRTLDGYDGMDPASFNATRQLAMLPGVQPLLGWNARGVDLESPVFRLFGVGWLVLRGPIDAPGFEAIAGPGMDDPAEVFVYRASDAMPRAFLVAKVLSHDELGELQRADAGAWDPAAVACVDGDWRPVRPFTHGSVEPPRFSNNRVELECELDGEGLLVLTEQAFPGWTVEVDGEAAEIMTADGIFRGVALGPGSHRVVFAYRPSSLVVGLWLAALGLAAAILLSISAAKSSSGQPSEASPAT